MRPQKWVRDVELGALPPLGRGVQAQKAAAAVGRAGGRGQEKPLPLPELGAEPVGC